MDVLDFHKFLAANVTPGLELFKGVWNLMSGFHVLLQIAKEHVLFRAQLAFELPVAGEILDVEGQIIFGDKFTAAVADKVALFVGPHEVLLFSQNILLKLSFPWNAINF